MKRRAVRTIASWVLIFAASALASCGGTNGPAEPKPLTPQQSERLSQAGYTNYLAKGAEFEANSAFLVPGGTESLTMAGTIDWENHRGRALVRGEGKDAGITEVYWEEKFILERRPGLDTVISSMGGPPTAWIARTPDPAARQLDRLVGLIVGMATEQPDNAVLIQQKEDAAFLRDDELRGTKVEVLRYSNRNIYWLDASDGSMLRFEGNSVGGNAPVVIDVLSRKDVDPARPNADDVVPAEQISEIYSGLMGN
jgi:hypothetical protein